MIKSKQGFLIRKLNDEYMIVAIGAASEQFNGMIRVNETGAFLWNALKDGITEEALVGKMLERFEDLDEATAKADLAEFLSAISVAIER